MLILQIEVYVHIGREEVHDDVDEKYAVHPHIQIKQIVRVALWKGHVIRRDETGCHDEAIFNSIRQITYVVITISQNFLNELSGYRSQRFFSLQTYFWL